MKKSILFLLALFSVTMTTQAVDYYYKGNQTGWSATAPMSVSSDGYYAYAEAKSYADNGNQNNHFKIALAADSWDFGADYLHGGFNGTDITNMGGWDTDGNCCIYHETSYYVLAYFPNTKINTTSQVKICASTFLPDDSETDLPEPEPVADVTVHVINSAKWAAVACYHWGEGGSGTSWPGDVLSKTDEIVGYDVYTATFTGEHTSCIFNNNNNGQQTGDLTVQNGQYYDLKSKTWYASLADVPAPDPLATDVFLVGSMNAWSTTANEFKKVEEGSATATLTMNLEAETAYEFKVVREGAWTSSEENITGSVSELVFSNTIDANTTMTTTVAGDYVFTWNDSKLSITYPASTEPDPTPDPADVTIYFVNTKSWSTVNAYVWGTGDPYKTWPGEAMTPTGENAHGYDVYSYTFPAEYTNCIFNGNGQTDDLIVKAGQYYDIASAQWYASLNDIPNPAPVVKETVYFVNTGSWEKVYAYAWKSSNNGWPGAELTANGEKIGEFDIYPFEAEQDQWANIIFNNNSGTQTADLVWETGKYYVYRTGEWYDTPEAAEEALAGPATIVLHGNFVNPSWADTEKLTISDDQKTATITVLIEKGSYEFGVKQNGEWVANGKAFTKDNNEHEIVAGSGNLTLVADITGNYTFTWTYETNTLTITYPTEEVVIEKHYYVRGSHTNWEVDEDYELTLTDGVYKKEVTLAKDVEFKINDGADAWWGKDNLGGKSYNELEGLEGGNLKMKEAKTFTIIFNPSENLITFEGLTEVETETLVYYVEVPAGTEKCYIAGQMNNWEFEPMTQVDATHWTITYDNVLKTTEYKYACQASWEYQEQKEDGGYVENRTWTALDRVEKWAEPAEVKYVLMGVNGDWTNGIPLTVNPDNADEYVLTDQVIIKATDAIKVVTLTNGVATAWCGNVDSWSNATYTGGGEDNIVLEDGIYTFYFKKTANNIYINQTGYARNVTNKYGTICLPYASASTAGATFFEVVGQEAGKVYLASVTELEAGVPYIFEKSANQIKVVYKGDKENDPVNTGANGLIGNFTNDKVVPAGNYILYNNEFRKSDGEAKVNAYRAYLNMDAVQGGKPTHTMPGRRYIGMSVQGENETTGVEDIFTTDAPVKVIVNGQLIIIREGVKYNVQGQKL